MHINNYSENVFQWLEKVSTGRFFVHQLSILLLLLSWFFVSPAACKFFTHPLPYAWDTILLKASDLTNNLEHIAPTSWRAKKVFRITIPVIIRLLQVSPAFIVLMQIVCGYALYYFSYRLVQRITGDAIQAILTTSSLAFLYFGRAAWFEFDAAWFDGFSYFFILMAMYTSSVWGIFLFSTMAAWNDERAFMALSIVLLFHFLSDKGDKKTTFKNLVSLNRQALAAAAAILAYILLRGFLSVYYHMHTPKDGANLDVLIHQTPNFLPLGAFTFMEGFWLLVLYGLVWVFFKRDYLMLFLLLAPILVLGMVAGCVTDITRSGSFMLPLVFVFIRYPGYFFRQSQMRSLLFSCFAITFLFPPVFVCLDWGAANWYFSPFLFKKILLLFGTFLSA
ncbi:MAG: hypothetical protein ACK5JC_01570 [Bacteroidota bacterium]|jgi:hypothetical protein